MWIATSAEDPSLVFAGGTRLVRALSPFLRPLAMLIAFAPAAPAQNIRIAPTPMTVIGRGGDERTQFNFVLTAWQFRNGEIVVVDPGASAPIRAFHANGSLSRVVAGTGSGPGEIGPTLYAASRAGDSVVTYEIAGARVSTFDIVRGIRTTASLILRGTPGRPVVQGVLPGHRWFIVGAPGGLRPHDDGPFRDTAWFGVAQAGQDSVHVVGRAARASFYANNKVQGPPNLQRVRYDSLVPWSTLLAHDGNMVIADPAAPAILVLDADGKEVRKIAPPFPSARYDRNELAKGRDAVLAATKTPYDSGMRAAMYDLAGRPGIAPAFKRVVPGPDGELWIEKFWLDETAPREFAVISRSGKLVTRVMAPAVRFTEFGRDYAIGVATDRDGVQTVVRFAVTR